MFTDLLAKATSRAEEAGTRVAHQAAREEMERNMAMGRQQAAGWAAQASDASAGYGARANAMWASGRDRAAGTYANVRQQAEAQAQSRKGKRVCSDDGFGLADPTQTHIPEDVSPRGFSFFNSARNQAQAAQAAGAAAAAQAGPASSKWFWQAKQSMPDRLPDTGSFQEQGQGLLDKGVGNLVGLRDKIGQNMMGHADLVAMASVGFGATGAMLAQRKMEAYDALFVMSEPLRMQMLLALREMVKELVVSDPEMPRCVQSRYETGVERFWSDIITYQEKLVEEARLAARGHTAVEHAELAILGHEPMMCSPFWWRAHILYTYLPFDRLIWGCIKNPLWWIMTILSLLPMYGIRVAFHLCLFILIVRSCPADSYQLVSFILGFKGTQVLSSGVAYAIIAACKFWDCIHSDMTHSCNVAGPGVDMDIWTGGVDFFGSTILVWVAFLWLPFSTNYAGSKDLDGAIADIEEVHSDVSGSESDGPAKRSKCCCCIRRRCFDPTRGGRLAGLLTYDVICLLFSLAVLVLLAQMDVSHAKPGGLPSVNVPVKNWEDIKQVVNSDFGTWKFRIDFFMVRIVYGFLSLPFLVFQLPIVNSILTHTRPTGYNLNGVCVPYLLPPMPPKTKGH